MVMMRRRRKGRKMFGCTYRVVSVFIQIWPGSGGLALQRQRRAYEYQFAGLAVVPERLRAHGQLSHCFCKLLVQFSLIGLAMWTVVY